jgi:hypothetical protein
MLRRFETLANIPDTVLADSRYASVECGRPARLEWLTGNYNAGKRGHASSNGRHAHAHPDESPSEIAFHSTYSEKDECLNG